MGRLSASRKIVVCGLALGLLSVLTGCGGHTPVPTSPFPAKVTLAPAAAQSVQMGATIHFLASAVNSSNTNLNIPFTFQSSDTSLLNFAPGGTACAGVWSNSFSVCNAVNSGLVQVTATADGIVSPPTYIFIHPPVDSIVVN